MDNQTLRAIKDELVNLPRVKQKLQNTIIQLEYAQTDVRKALNLVESEARDVAALEKENFFTMLLKMANKYNGKFEKEEKEFLEAKLNYDCAVQKEEVLQKDCDVLKVTLEELEHKKAAYEEALIQKGEMLMHSLTSEQGKDYRQLELERNKATVYLNELGEALTAANNVNETIKRIKGHLDKARDWASYDMWCGNGIFSHMAKYEHIDDAKREFRSLFEGLYKLQKEMKDIGYDLAIDEIGIDSTTRTLDFWFDNIFTDMVVRNKIEDDLESMNGLERRVSTVLSELINKKREVETQLSVINDKQELIILQS